jgi:hypothetical protein
MTPKLATIATFVRNDHTTFSPHKPHQRSAKNTTWGRRLRDHRGEEKLRRLGGAFLRDGDERAQDAG